MTASCVTRRIGACLGRPPWRAGCGFVADTTPSLYVYRPPTLSASLSVSLRLSFPPSPLQPHPHTRTNACTHARTHARTLPTLCHRYGTKQTATQEVTAEDIPALAEESFPLCMRTAQQRLQETHHMRHGGRMQYGLFLKGIGLSLQEALLFWRIEVRWPPPSSGGEAQSLHRLPNPNRLPRPLAPSPPRSLAPSLPPLLAPSPPCPLSCALLGAHT